MDGTSRWSAETARCFSVATRSCTIQAREREQLLLVGGGAGDVEVVGLESGHRLLEGRPSAEGRRTGSGSSSGYPAGARQRHQRAVDVLDPGQDRPQEEWVLAPPGDAEVAARLEVEGAGRGEVGTVVAHHRAAVDLDGEPRRNLEVRGIGEDPVTLRDRRPEAMRWIARPRRRRGCARCRAHGPQ